MIASMDNPPASAFWVTSPGRGEIRCETLQHPGAGQLRVRTLYSGISRGTESLVFSGRVPESEYGRMRAPFQAGEFPGPVKYGYSSVGVVDAGPPEWLDRRVFCLYPHQDRYVVPIEAVHPLPDDVPAGRAVLAANMETALNGAWDAAPLIGDEVRVIGAGVVGCLTAWLLGRIPGCRVELVDLQPGRAAVARALGVAFATPATARGEADRVIHASGSAAGLALALELAATEALVLEMSWFGDRPVSLDLGAAFHSRRLTLRASQVGQLPPQQRPRWDHRRRLSLALALLAAPELDVLISGESTLHELPARMPELADSGGATLCHRIRYFD
jgi:threonine dehydrogenase-like Zn-dependent dehydrogenase